MTVKEYLMQYQERQERIKELDFEIQTLENSMTSIKSFNYDDCKVQISHTHDKIGDMYALIDQKKRYLSQYTADTFNIRIELIEKTTALHNILYAQILQLKYIEGLNLKEISLKLGYSYQYIRETSSKAFKLFKEKYKEEICTNGKST